MNAGIPTPPNPANVVRDAPITTGPDDAEVERVIVFESSPWRTRLTVALQLVTLAFLPAPPIATYMLMRSSYETAICIAASGAATASTPDQAAQRIAQSCELPGP